MALTETFKGCALFLGIMVLIFFSVLLLEMVVLLCVYIWQEYFADWWRVKLDKRKKKI